jgi:rhamnosyltransferase
MKKEILISVVIPVYNGIKTLPDLINGISKQTIFNNLEIVVIDSGSNDGSIEYLSQFDYVRILQIVKSDFNHGKTRNIAVQNCEGQFVFMTVQDAWTNDKKLLEKMLIHFKNEHIHAVCGHQIVPQESNKNPHEWFRPQDKPSFKLISFNRLEFQQLSPEELRAFCGWDNVISVYRKKSLIELPFEEIIFGEDMLWAKMALSKGWAICYDNSCLINHYHHAFSDYIYKRTLISKLFIFKCFNFFDARNYSFKQYFLIVYRNFKWKCHIKWILHNWKIVYQYNKATSILLKHRKNNSLHKLELDFKLNVPIGKTNS